MPVCLVYLMINPGSVDAGVAILPDLLKEYNSSGPLYSDDAGLVFLKHPDSPCH